MSSMLLAGLSPDDLAILFEPNPYAYDSTVTDPSQPPSPFVQAMREQEEMFFAAFPEARKAAEYRERRKEHLLALLASRNANFFPSTRPYCRQGPLHSQPSLQPQPTVPVAAFTAPLNHTYETLIYEDVPQLVPATPTVYYQTHGTQPDSHLPPRQHSLHRIKEEPEPESKPQITLPTYVPTPQQQQQPHSPTHHDRHPQKVEPHPEPQHINKDKPTSTIRRDRGADRVDRPSKPRPSTTKPSYTARPRSTKIISNPSGSKRRVGPQLVKRQRQPHQLDGRKPTLACLFCRGRKIACGAPSPGSTGKTCNQCQRRSLRCEFPAESRRGMKKRKILGDSDEGPDDQSSLPCESVLSP